MQLFRYCHMLQQVCLFGKAFHSQTKLIINEEDRNKYFKNLYCILFDKNEECIYSIDFDRPSRIATLSRRRRRPAAPKRKKENTKKRKDKKHKKKARRACRRQDVGLPPRRRKEKKKKRKRRFVESGGGGGNEGGNGQDNIENSFLYKLLSIFFV